MDFVFQHSWWGFYCTLIWRSDDQADKRNAMLYGFRFYTRWCKSLIHFIHHSMPGGCCLPLCPIHTICNDNKCETLHSLLCIHFTNARLVHISRLLKYQFHSFVVWMLVHFLFILFIFTWAPCVFVQFTPFALCIRDLFPQMNFCLQCPTYITTNFIHSVRSAIQHKQYSTRLAIFRVTRKCVQWNFLRQFNWESQSLFFVELFVRNGGGNDWFEIQTMHFIFSFSFFRNSSRCYPYRNTLKFE